MPDETETYPRVLVISAEPFNSERGCGITLSNLFNGWPKDRILALYWLNVIPDGDACITQHRLEHSWPAPLKFLLRTKQHSGNIQSVFTESTQAAIVKKELSFKDVLKAVERKIGMSSIFKTVKIQSQVKTAIVSFQPEVIYSVVSGANAISVVRQTLNIADVPLVIHVFDDWLAKKRAGSVLEIYSHRSAATQFRAIVEEAKVRMAIGDLMSQQFGERFGKKFHPFQNAPDPELWLTHGKINYDAPETFLFRFTGNIYDGGNLQALADFSRAVEIVSSSGKRAALEIYTTSEAVGLYASLFADNASTKLLPTVQSITEMATLYGSCDGMVIVCNFDESGHTMLGMSMPTKLPTTMIAGVPLFVYAPADTAMADFVLSNNIGYVVDKVLPARELVTHISKFIDKTQDRENRAVKARQLALEKFASGSVRPRFRDALRQSVFAKDGMEIQDIFENRVPQ